MMCVISKTHPECWDGEKQLCISQVVEGLATNSGKFSAKKAQKISNSY